MIPLIWFIASPRMDFSIGVDPSCFTIFINTLNSSSVNTFFGSFFGSAFSGNLNDPDAPFPFVCQSCPFATADFIFFFINGAILTTSTLYSVTRNFLMVCNEDPLGSFNFSMALKTISRIGGCFSGAFNFWARSTGSKSPIFKSLLTSLLLFKIAASRTCRKGKDLLFKTGLKNQLKI